MYIESEAPSSNETTECGVAKPLPVASDNEITVSEDASGQERDAAIEGRCGSGKERKTSRDGNAEGVMKDTETYFENEEESDGGLDKEDDSHEEEAN